MSSIEEEVNKLHEDITRFLSEEGGVDSGDENNEPSVAPRARPGSITPLGVRVDRGAGLLGSNGVTATLGEMDSVLNSIRSWKQKHEREMLELRQRNEQALSLVASADSQAEQTGGAGATAPGGGSSAVKDPGGTHALLPSPVLPAARSSSRGASASNLSAAAAAGETAGGPSDGRGAQPPRQQQQRQFKGAREGQPQSSLQLGEEDDEDLAELVRERRERRDRVLSGVAAGRLRVSAATGQAPHAQGQGDADAELQQRGRSGDTSSSSQPWSLAEQPPLESVLRASLAGPALQQHLLGAVPAERPTTAARRKAEAAASAAVLRGQQLLAELEAELLELEGGGVGGRGLGSSGSGSCLGAAPAAAAVTLAGTSRPGSGGSRSSFGSRFGPGAQGAAEHGSGNENDRAGVCAAAAAESSQVESLVEWSAQLQGVLAKMDALQTGYQAAAAVAETAATGRAGGAVGSRPGSGGAVPDASSGSAGLAAPGSPSLSLRPGSARLRLEPLSRMPGLPTGSVSGAGHESRLPAGLSRAAPASSSSPAAAAAAGEASGTAMAGAGLGGDGQGPAGKGAVFASGGAAGGVNSEPGPVRSKDGSGAVGQAPEAVPCAGHRIRQLRELQRQQGAGGGGGRGDT